MHTAEMSNGYENKEPRMHMGRGKDEESLRILYITMDVFVVLL